MLARGSFTPIVLSTLPSILSFIIYLIWLDIFIYLSIIFVLLPIFTIIFFRDPERKIGNGLVSPADGKVIKLDKEENSLDIFMNITDVHVNRSPDDGEIIEIKTYEGEYNPAFNDESEKNHKKEILLRTKNGDITIWQIVGFLARRIVPYINKREEVSKGERIGMIRFGSRVRIRFPKNVDIEVGKGDKVIAGESKIGEWK